MGGIRSFVPSGTSGQRERTRDRGISTVIGVVFLVAIVMLALGIIGVLGVGSFTQTKENVDVELVERELVKLSGVVEDVAFGASETRRVQLRLDTLGAAGTTHVRSDLGHMTVVVGNRSVTNTTVYDGALGGLDYENRDVHLSYQGGGVWRRQEGGSVVMVSRPPFSARNYSIGGSSSRATLTLPILTVEGQATLSSGATVIDRGHTDAYPALFVPEGEVIVVTIESEYASAWARYFRDRLGFPDSQVSVGPGGERMKAVYGVNTEAYLHATVYTVRIERR